MEEESNHKGHATASLLLGLLFWVPLFNMATGPLAVLLGTRAIIKMRKLNQISLKHAAMAIAGTALGMVPLVFGLLYALIKSGIINT
ncbi:hypothetical protein HY640_00830 [Candidatus Woesearchaeota archaeon]|nr:hypothetical protein [Candidatus Woesearchaeota archaeon]